MNFGTYIKHLRNTAKITQRKLEELSGISNAEISRIETGERKNPSPQTLKAIAPHLGVTYDELMKKAGYIEEVFSRGNFEDVVWKDDKGELVDTFRRQFMNIQQKDPELISILDRAVDSSSKNDLDTIKNILKEFIGDNLNEEQKEYIRKTLELLKK
jgi:HTH-type transcriptional regulator, competence development regulator